MLVNNAFQAFVYSAIKEDIIILKFYLIVLYQVKNGN